MAETYCRLRSTIEVPKSVKDFGTQEIFAEGEKLWLPKAYAMHLINEKLALAVDASEQEKADDAEADPDFESFSEDQLVALAGEKNVAIASGDTKAEIIAKLKA